MVDWYPSQLDLGVNMLCGIDREGNGTYTSEGIIAIADALRVNASLTNLSYVCPKFELVRFGYHPSRHS